MLACPVPPMPFEDHSNIHACQTGLINEPQTIDSVSDKIL